MKVIYIVDLEQKRYESVWCEDQAAVEKVEETVWAVADLFCIENICIKYVEPVFEEDEVCE